MQILSTRMDRIKPSGTLAAADSARRLKAEGKKVFDLAEGEPDFPTPTHIQQAAKKNIDGGMVRYTAADGIPELKKAIQSKYAVERGVEISLDRIIVGSGAKQLIFCAFMATLDEGDEVIAPVPCWVSYKAIAEVFGGKFVPIDTDEESHFKPTVKKIAENITVKTKWLILNSPNNPTGAVYGREFFSELETVLAKYPQVMVMSDEIYEDITFTGKRADSIIDSAPKLSDRIFLINGVSKKYAMTGWRLGYALGPKELVTAVKTLIGQSTTNACSISQEAAVEALTGSQEFFKAFNREYALRKELMMRELDQMEGLSYVKPEGAFYIFISCKKFLNKGNLHNGKPIKSDVDFVSYILEESGVSGVPGSAFGKEGYFRLCFAKSQEELKEAMGKMKEAIKNLHI